MGDTYGKVSEEADKQWLLERARITFSIQNEMSIAELYAPEYRYWTDIKGVRYLQVISPDADHYQSENTQESENIRNLFHMPNE